MRLLITGGAGYIGCHTTVLLLQAGWEVVIVDNLSNSKYEAILRVEKVTGKKIQFYCIDIRDERSMNEVFCRHRFAGVLHFACKKVVAESVTDPLSYYQHNLLGTLVLLQTMRCHHVFSLVYSSSAAVYGTPRSNPVTEDAPLKAVSPYGRLKIFCEELLQDLRPTGLPWSIALLRYFNPLGAHESGLLGDNPLGTAQGIMPLILRVAKGEQGELRVFGNDYPTRDGTGERDYIHVMDLAKGHLDALEWVLKEPRIDCFNLGTGTPYTVLELISTFQEVSGLRIPYRFVEKRPGDVASSYADPKKAEDILCFTARKDLYAMCQDAYYFLQRNPKGF